MAKLKYSPRRSRFKSLLTSSQVCVGDNARRHSWIPVPLPSGRRREWDIIPRHWSLPCDPLPCRCSVHTAHLRGPVYRCKRVSAGKGSLGPLHSTVQSVVFLKFALMSRRDVVGQSHRVREEGTVPRRRPRLQLHVKEDVANCMPASHTGKQPRTGECEMRRGCE